METRWIIKLQVRFCLPQSSLMDQKARLNKPKSAAASWNSLAHRTSQAASVHSTRKVVLFSSTHLTFLPLKLPCYNA